MFPVLKNSVYISDDNSDIVLLISSAYCESLSAFKNGLKPKLIYFSSDYFNNFYSTLDKSSLDVSNSEEY